METKNLTKSFGIRVPLELYLKMIEVSAENKVSVTDICLHSLMHSGVMKEGFNFKNGGALNTDGFITEIKSLKEQLAKAEKSRSSFRQLMEQGDEELDRLKKEHKESISAWRDIVIDLNKEIDKLKANR